MQDDTKGEEQTGIREFVGDVRSTVGELVADPKEFARNALDDFDHLTNGALTRLDEAAGHVLEATRQMAGDFSLDSLMDRLQVTQAISAFRTAALSLREDFRTAILGGPPETLLPRDPGDYKSVEEILGSGESTDQRRDRLETIIEVGTHPIGQRVAAARALEQLNEPPLECVVENLRIIGGYVTHGLPTRTENHEIVAELLRQANTALDEFSADPKHDGSAVDYFYSSSIPRAFLYGDGSAELAREFIERTVALNPKSAGHLTAECLRVAINIPVEENELPLGASEFARVQAARTAMEISQTKDLPFVFTLLATTNQKHAKIAGPQFVKLLGDTPYDAVNLAAVEALNTILSKRKDEMDGDANLKSELAAAVRNSSLNPVITESLAHLLEKLNS